MLSNEPMCLELCNRCSPLSLEIVSMLSNEPMCLEPALPQRAAPSDRVSMLSNEPMCLERTLMFVQSGERSGCFNAL